MTSNLINGDFVQSITRRHFFASAGIGIGAAALTHLLEVGASASSSPQVRVIDKLHFQPRAKRVIFLFMSGGPSQMDLLDYKPALNERNGQELPASVRMGQRLTSMSANQSSLPLAGSAFKFKQHGKCGRWVSELLPHTAGVVDELCVVKSVFTEAINHDPAITFFQTGAQIAGRPSIGAWLSYGLGTSNENLPAFCVLVSSKGKPGQPLYARLWGNGFLPSQHQGVQFRSGKDPVLFLNNPQGISAASRRSLFDCIAQLNESRFRTTLNPAVESKIEQYEMAARMQSSVPEVTDLSREPDHVFEMYGPNARIPGTFAANCLLARRLAERDVRFVQLFHKDWDHHGSLPGELALQCQETDQPCAALIRDLKQRGMLEDTLVVWGGEFGRTAYSQGKLTATDYGRDHHPRCFTMWMAGGGVKSGIEYGKTDDFSYNIDSDPAHVHDVQATILHLMGIDHERLTYMYQGRRFRLTDVSGRVIDRILI